MKKLLLAPLVLLFMLCSFPFTAAQAVPTETELIQPDGFALERMNKITDNWQPGVDLACYHRCIQPAVGRGPDDGDSMPIAASLHSAPGDNGGDRTDPYSGPSRGGGTLPYIGGGSSGWHFDKERIPITSG